LSTISAEQVKELRERTGVGMMECKKALTEAGGDVEKAIEQLRKSGMAKAAKKAGREASEGVVEAYIHPGGRVGVLIEVNCETDFVARTEDFQTLVKNLAMQVAAMSALAVRREEVSTEMLDRERDIYAAQLRAEGKPEELVERIVKGKMEKFYEEHVLLEQPYVRDDKKTVGDMVQEAIGRLGENIVVRRFQRFALGGE
jgi:elongation factor Ts